MADQQNPALQGGTCSKMNTAEYPYDIESTISYLARDDLWSKEKPYIADFAVPEGATLSNQIIKKEPVTIYDLRGRSEPLLGPKVDSDGVRSNSRIDGYSPTLSENGFCIVSMTSTLTANEALQGPRSCEEKYFEEIKATMEAHFPEYRRFECIDLTVRRREPTFPWDGEVKLLKHEQPAAVAHTDYSLEGALMELTAVYPGQEDYFVGKRFDVINVWRPLHGPNDDWPLAICDGLTVSPEDIRDSDVVHYDRIGENTLLHSNEKHRWYYLSGQAANECLVFRNISSVPQRTRAFHAAFYNPRSNGKGRVSAEARVLAFF